MADAGRVIAGSARGHPAGRPGPRDAAAGRPGEAGALRDRWSRCWRTRTSSTCAPAAARPRSRRCRAAPRGRSSWSTTPRPVRVIGENLRRAGVAEPGAQSCGATRSPTCGSRAAAATARSTSSSWTRPTRTSRSGTPACASSAGRMRRSGRGALVIATRLRRSVPAAGRRAATIDPGTPVRRDDRRLLRSRRGGGRATARRRLRWSGSCASRSTRARSTRSRSATWTCCAARWASSIASWSPSW